MFTEQDVLQSVACDYITATGPEGDARDTLHEYASSLLRTEAQFGNDMKPWGMSGFKGWSCGHVQVGVLDHSFICRLSGDAAARSWRGIVERASRVTRIDVQATVMVQNNVTDVIDWHRSEATEFCATSKGNHLARWIQDTKGGYTLYLGARTSNVFGRIYDKWAREKMDQYLSCVRYEVQFNSRLARMVSTMLLSARQDGPAMASYILQFLRSRGVSPPGLDDAGLTYCCRRGRSDSDRKLVWLKQAVRPSVLSLIADGRGEEVFRALGLVDDGPSDVEAVDSVN